MHWANNGRRLWSFRFSKDEIWDETKNLFFFFFWCAVCDTGDAWTCAHL